MEYPTIKTERLKRLLVTGSRDWNDPTVLMQKLDEACVFLTGNIMTPIVLISGHCNKGADAMAEVYWRSRNWPIEIYPADWVKYGNSAGFRRNADMVRTMPNVCVAFIRNNSKGATHTADLSRRAGIVTFVTEMND